MPKMGLASYYIIWDDRTIDRRFSRGEEPLVAFEIWARATAKWRGMLVYILLQATMRFVTSVILMQEPTQGLRLYATLAGVATSIYCMVRMWTLMLKDEPGDENWPPLWS